MVVTRTYMYVYLSKVAMHEVLRSEGWDGFEARLLCEGLGQGRQVIRSYRARMDLPRPGRVLDGELNRVPQRV